MQIILPVQKQVITGTKTEENNGSFIQCYQLSFSPYAMKQLLKSLDRLVLFAYFILQVVALLTGLFIMLIWVYVYFGKWLDNEKENAGITRILSFATSLNGKISSHS